MAQVWLLIYLVFFLFMGNPSFAASPQAPKTGGTLRFGLQKDIVSLNPFQRTQSVTKNVGSIAFECLLTADKNDELKPALATSWTVSEDSLHYNFTLRQGVKFHNGKDMTAEDVLWSLQYARDAKNAAQGRYMLLAVASAAATGPATVRITLKEPYIPFLAALASFEAFPVVLKDSVPAGRGTLSRHPPGTGPFMMTEYRPHQLIAFKRFDQYWQKGMPYLDGVHFKPVDDDAVRLTAIRSGDLDVIERVLYDQVLQIRKGEIKGLGVIAAEASGYVAPAFNTAKPPFNNAKLRKAVLLALDKGKILDGVAWGLGVVADQKMPKHSRWFVPLTPHRRDIEKAKMLMKEAGYPDGLRLKAQVANAKRDQDVMQMIQGQLREVGIQIELEVRDFARHLNDLRDGSFTFSMSAGASYIDPDLSYYDSFHSESGARRISNYPRYANPKMDALLDQGRREADFGKRYRIYKEVVELLQEEVPDIPLGFTPHIFAFRSYVKDFQVQPTGPYYYGLGGIGMTWIDR